MAVTSEKISKLSELSNVASDDILHILDVSDSNTNKKVTVGNLPGSAATISGLTDTTITSIAANELLQWNGSAWINQTLAELGTGITVTGTIVTGVWNGTAIASANLDTDTVHLSVAQTFSAAHTFEDDHLKIQNPAATFDYTITGAAIAADRALTLPLTTGADTLASLGLSQTFTGTTTLNSFKGTGAVTVTNILDEDTMSSDSATALASQQSIKAYVDATAGGISNIVEDTTPELGGSLDALGLDIDNLGNITMDENTVHTISIERNAAITDDKVIGQLVFKAHEDVGGTPVLGTYGSMVVTVEDETQATEDASFKFNAYTGGTLGTWMKYNDAGDATINLLKNTKVTGTLDVSGILDTLDIETATVSARDGSLAITIANTSGISTFVTGAVLVAPVLGTVASGIISACTSTSMVMVTPVLGTPASGTLTSCTGLPLAGLTNAAKEETWSFAISDNTTALTTGTKLTWYTPYAITLTDIQASVLTAPTDAELIIDVHEAGTTIMTTNKLDIEVGEFHTNDAATQPALSDTSLAAGAKIEFIIDQIGSTIAGAGAIVYFVGYQT